MIETDKARVVRRRFAKHSGHKQLLSASLEKSKKEKTKRLSAVNSNNTNNRARGTSSCCCPEDNCEMVGGVADVSDREEELLPSTSKRFKLPRKFFDDCNGVDHASVPRKLRSAMKKRNCGSISPPSLDSKKLNFTTGGVELCKRDGVKKFKLNVKQGDRLPKQTLCGPITKDEEEVAETLSALAGMFSDNLPNNENKSGCASLDTSRSLPEASKCAMEDSVVVKEDLNSICPFSPDEVAAPASNMESLPEGTAIVASNKSNSQEPSDFPGSLNGYGDLNSSQLSLQTMLAEDGEQKTSSNSVNLGVPNELYQNPGNSKQPIEIETRLLERSPEIALGLATAMGSQLDRRPNQSIKNGPALWPGLSSTASNDVCSRSSPSRSSATRIPAWLDSALCGGKPGSFQTGSLTGKVPKANTDRRSLKRCAAHIYISQLIQDLKMQESQRSLQPHPNQLRPHEILKQGVLMTINDFNGVRNGLKGVKSTSTMFSATEKNSNESGNSILQYRRLDQDQPPQTSVEARDFNFLSLSPGGRVMEVSTSFSGPVKEMEPSAQLQVAYPHSNMRHPMILPFSMSQTRYPSSSYADQPSATVVQQAQLQLPHYLGSPFYGSTATIKQNEKQHQHQQQQQQLWAAQLAAQYRTGGTSAGMTQFSSWQNGMQQSATLLPCGSAVIPSSASSIEVPDAKYQQISQQQQQLMAFTSSLPHARVTKQDHHLSSVYEETGVGFRAGSALPLQLLCNERL